ncbi:hypothetical protein cypCar_00008906 [Cyprinus carpio]|nr:hypothetical protein cypCar_00008906 [Cyprinus carpio]
MVTSKETCAAIIVLQQNGLTCKALMQTATKNIASERTIYRIIKSFKERGLTAVTKSSGPPRVSSKCQDRLLLRSQLWNLVTIRAELAQEWQQVGVKASAHTVRPSLVDNGLVSRRAAKRHFSGKINSGQTEILQQVQGLDSRRLVHSCFL